jgi:hypothetical protein
MEIPVGLSKSLVSRLDGRPRPIERRKAVGTMVQITAKIRVMAVHNIEILSLPGFTLSDFWKHWRRLADGHRMCANTRAFTVMAEMGLLSYIGLMIR